MGSDTIIGTVVGTTTAGLDRAPAAGADTLGGLAYALAACGVVALSALALHFVLGDPLPWQWEAWWHVITGPKFADVVRLVSLAR